MKDKLPCELYAEVDVSLMKTIEYEFHTAGYHALLSVSKGLRIVVEYLIKVLINQALKCKTLGFVTKIKQSHTCKAHDFVHIITT